MVFDLIIVGGGLAGAALAVALRSSSLKVAVVETRGPVRGTDWDTRIYAYSPANVNFLKKLGVWSNLDQTRLSPVHEMNIYGDTTGALHFSAYQSGLTELAWIGESALVHQELWENLRRQHNVSLFCPAAPTALEVDQAGVTLTLMDGQVLSGRLIVGADGRDSWVRSAAGIQARVLPYGEMGVVANFVCEHAHRQIAHQWFSEEGILAWLPLPGNLMSMVWSVNERFAESLLEMDEQSFCARVAAAGQHKLGALFLLTPRAAFSLRLMRVDTVVKSRVALLGDAAHAIHPLSGHGINLGFQDAQALAGILCALPAWRDPGEWEVLRTYARQRAEEPFLLQYATHGLNRLFACRHPLAVAARNAGLNLTDRLPVITNTLVRYAAFGKF